MRLMRLRGRHYSAIVSFIELHCFVYFHDLGTLLDMEDNDRVFVSWKAAPKAVYFQAKDRLARSFAE